MEEDDNTNIFMQRNLINLYGVDWMEVEPDQSQKDSDEIYEKKIEGRQISNGKMVLLNGIGLKKIPTEVLYNESLTHLDLANNYISALNEKITLVNLSTLLLGGNLLYKIPSTLGAFCPSLTSLTLNRNFFVTIPGVIFELLNLEHLDLTENKIEEIDPKISNLQKLKVLYLDANAFKKFPKKLLSLLNLQSLRLSHNNIQTLPKEISNLKLRRLSLCKCNMTKFPESVCKVTTLEMLELSGNNFSTIPSNFIQLKSLTILRLEKGKFSYLSSYFGDLTKLFLAENKIKDILFDMGLMTSLEILDLSHNKLTEIPETIGKILNLKILKLSHNELHSLPKDFSSLKSLEELYLNKNRFINFPTVLAENETKALTNLEVLNLSDNSIPSISKDIVYLTRLKNLYIKRLKLKNLPISESFKKMPNLRCIVLVGCPILHKHKITLKEYSEENNVKVFEITEPPENYDL